MSIGADGNGLLILGTEADCGKTVITAGLAAAIQTLGFRVQAYKPLEFLPNVSLVRGLDQQFHNRITQQFLHAETALADSPWDVTASTWHKVIESLKALEFPGIIESPMQVGMPWRIQGQTLIDAVDIARQFNYPILLVGRAEPAFMARMRLALEYLQSRQMNVIGFIKNHVQTPVEAMDAISAEAMLLAQHYTVPFLGEMPYSPSISVASRQQGNLIRLIQDNIDLLPIQFGMGLTL